MKALYPNPADYNTYMGQVMFMMAILASLASLFTTSRVIQRYSWTACALISPVLVTATGLIFFQYILFPNQGFSWMLNFFDVSPLMLCVTLGSMQNCISRTCKYTFFDATKEISFIPLSKESKLKGKAAIDGVGSRIGKSGGSVIHQSLILLFSSVAGSVPYVAVIFLIIAAVWTFSVIYLGRQFEQATRQPDGAIAN